MIKLSNVSKEYPKRGYALRDVSFQIGKGEFAFLTGHSGSGKSTVLRLIHMADRPTSGEVTVAGHDVSTMSDAKLSGLRSAHIGFVFQAFHLLTGYSALDNVADGLLYTGMSLDDRRARAYEALVTVGLGNRLDHVATQLSGGEGQRVAIARAIVTNAKLFAIF